MTESIPEVRYTPVHVNQPDLTTVFHDLTGLVGAAVVSGHELTCALQFKRTIGTDKGQPWWYGGFSLQTTSEDPERPGIQFRVGKSGTGIYAEHARHIGNNDANRWPALRRATRTHDTPLFLHASRIIRQTQEVIAAASTHRVTPPPWETSLSQPRYTIVPSQLFIHRLGEILALADKRVRFTEVTAAIDTKQLRVIGRAGTLHQITGNAVDQNHVVEFKLAHDHSAPAVRDTPQLVSLTCDVTITPRIPLPDGFLRAHDSLEASLKESRPGWESYRTQWIIPKHNPTAARIISRDLSTGEDMLDMAQSLADPGHYLATRWPSLQ